MLKLERASLKVILRKREPFFSRDLALALAFAIGIHLAAFILFPIATSKFKGSVQVLAPVTVAVDLPIVVATLEGEELPTGYLQPPKSEALILPPLPEPVKPKLAQYPQEVSVAILEVDPVLERLDPPQKGVKPIVVHVTGPLSKYRHSEPIALSIPKGLSRVIYSVRMENRSGEIFWYESSVVNPLAEKILRNLHFETDQGFVTEGEVEIAFYG